MKNEFKGTPGPWVASTADRSIGPVSTDDDQSYGMIIPVAWVEYDGDIGHQKPNAQLIAAAPELLEALQDMVALVKQRAYPQPDKPSSHWGRAEAAQEVINKALGETK